MAFVSNKVASCSFCTVLPLGEGVEALAAGWRCLHFLHLYINRRLITVLHETMEPLESNNTATHNTTPAVLLHPGGKARLPSRFPRAVAECKRRSVTACGILEKPATPDRPMAARPAPLRSGVPGTICSASFPFSPFFPQRRAPSLAAAEMPGPMQQSVDLPPPGMTNEMLLCACPSTPRFPLSQVFPDTTRK